MSNKINLGGKKGVRKTRELRRYVLIYREREGGREGGAKREEECNLLHE